MKHRKYPIALDDVDLSGKIKMMTLEWVLLKQNIKGWCSVMDLYRNPIFRLDHFYLSGSRCISIRLLRYYRAGLLQRRRKGRIFEYRLSRKGEDRLLYLWEKLGCLKPPLNWESEGRLGIIEKELAEKRNFLAIQLLENQIQRQEKSLYINP